MKLSYLNDTWNILDVSKVMFTNVYLMMELVEPIDDDDLNMRFILSVAIFLAWIRLIGFLRLIEATRPLIRMIIEILKEMIPFMVIFLMVLLR
jgi:hypothetical protein